MMNEPELFDNTGEAITRTLGYIPSPFLFCKLPAKNFGLTTYEHTYNNLSLRLESSKGIPGGKIARDMLALFTTACVVGNYYEEKEGIKLKYNSMRELILNLKIISNDCISRIYVLLECYSSCVIFFEMRKFTNNSDSKTELYAIKNVPIFAEYKCLKTEGAKIKNGANLPIEIKLSYQFKNMVKNHSVPIDYDVYREIGSSIGKDMYVWITYRMNSFIPEEGIFISREQLLNQFINKEDGENEKRDYQRILEELVKIKTIYYTDLNLKIKRGAPGKRNTAGNGVILYKSKPVITMSDKRYVPLIDRRFLERW